MLAVVFGVFSTAAPKSRVKLIAFGKLSGQLRPLVRELTWLSIDAPAWLAYLKPAFVITGTRCFGARLTQD